MNICEIVFNVVKNNCKCLAGCHHSAYLRVHVWRVSGQSREWGSVDFLPMTGYSGNNIGQGSHGSFDSLSLSFHKVCLPSFLTLTLSFNKMWSLPSMTPFPFLLLHKVDSPPFETCVSFLCPTGTSLVYNLESALMSWM